MNHARLAPSAAHRFIKCPPSVVMNEQFEDVPSIYAKEGTLAHELAALKMRHEFDNNGQVSMYDYQGIYESSLERIKNDELYSPEMDEYVQEYIDFVENVTSLMYRSKSTLGIEEKVDLSFLAPETFGTVDCFHAIPGTLNVFDFKYGQNVEVSAEYNEQLMLYALGIIEQYDIIYDFEHVFLYIVQPRMNNISIDSMSAKELIRWGQNVFIPAAELALKGEGTAVYGEHCKFCKAKAICKAYSQHYDPNIKKDNPNKLSLAEIGELLTQYEGLESYIKTLKSYALEAILEGEDIPGYKAVEGRSNRQWTDQREAFLVAEENGYDHAVLYEQKPLTLTEVEKLMGKKEFSRILGKYVEKPLGKPTLAPESDNRESYSYISAQEEFKDINLNEV